MIPQSERFNGREINVREIRVVEAGRGELETAHGIFTLLAYQALHSDITYPVLLKKPIEGNTSLVRVHSQCATGDILGSLRCDCGPQKEESIRLIGQHGGVFIYASDHEGRAIGLGNKVKAYALQDLGLDTVEANHALGFPTDARDYGITAAILKELGLLRIRLLTNSPHKVGALEEHGIIIAECVPLCMPKNGVNDRYLDTKKEKLNHRL